MEDAGVSFIFCRPRSTLKRGFLSRPALSAFRSGPASEISSLVSGDDFSDRLLVSTCISSPLAQQDLVVRTQNGVNMASGTPSTSTTAPSTAPLPLTAGPSMAPLKGPSTIELIVPIVAPLGAQDTPSVIQELGRSLVLSRQCSLLQYTAPCRTAVYGTLPYYRIWHPCRLRHPCCKLPCLLCQQGLLTQWVIKVRAISSLLGLTPIGCL